MRIILFIIVLFYCSCKNSTKTSINSNVQLKDSFPAIKIAGQNQNGTSYFYPISCGLYLDRFGTIALKSIDNTGAIIGEKTEDIYLTTAWGYDTLDWDGGHIELKKLVDTITFKFLSDYYFMDKNHVYDFQPMIDGGAIGILWAADPKHFKVFSGTPYAADKKNCYYHGQVIQGADPNSFKAFNADFAYDKDNVFEDGIKLSASEVLIRNLYNIKTKNGG